MSPMQSLIYREHTNGTVMLETKEPYALGIEFCTRSHANYALHACFNYSPLHCT